MSDLFIPVILGTVRQGRMSEPVAEFVVERIRQTKDVTTELIDIRALPIPLDDAGPNAKIPGFAETVARADAYILVVPEYNHGYPGMLKHVLDLNYKEYLHKAVGVCSVSAGGFGGIRAVDSLLSSFKAFGLAATVADLNVSNVATLFDESGRMTEEATATYSHRLDRFLQELLWLAKTLKYGREHFS